MASVFFKEAREPGKDWERLTMAKSEAGAQDAVDVARSCNEDTEYRVARYARVESTAFHVEAYIRGAWRTIGEQMGAENKDIIVKAIVNGGDRCRVTTVNFGSVETFAPKGGV